MSRLVYFDLETTGVDPWTDKIVEFCFVEGNVNVYRGRANPRRPIPAEATAVHGISDEDVRELPTFGHHAEAIQEIVAGAVLVGYNSRRFDTIMLHQELRNSGQLGLAVDERDRIIQREIDLLEIWRRVEPRNLSTALLRFAGVELEDAHSATADTEALPLVLRGMAEAFGLERDVDALCRLTVPEHTVDRDGKFERDADGRVLFSIGKHKGEPIHREPGFLEWMLSKDFSPDTLGWVRLFLDEIHAGRNPHAVK